jgi:anti-anti-sigma factor
MHYRIAPEQKTLTVTIPGDVLSTNLEELRTRMHTLIAPPPTGSDLWTTLVLDLSATKMIDSAGLNFLVSLVRTIGARGGKVSARALQPQILRAFKFTRLDQHITLLAP